LSLTIPHGGVGKYEIQKQATLNTWASHRVEGIDILNVEGDVIKGHPDISIHGKHQWKSYSGSSEDIQKIKTSIQDKNYSVFAHNENNFLKLNVPDSYGLLIIKTLLSFEYLLNNFNHRFFFRTINGGFVVQENLLEVFKRCPDTNFVTGSVGVWDSQKYGDIVFVGGMNMLMSRDVVEKMVDHKDDMIDITLQNQKELVDDRVYGLFFRSFGIPITDPRSVGYYKIDINDENQVETKYNSNAPFYYFCSTGKPIHNLIMEKHYGNAKRNIQ
jgi:hypothetical protein